ncbi:hypothetical protein GW17_00041813, partial [Ensete ventricosum]
MLIAENLAVRSASTATAHRRQIRLSVAAFRLARSVPAPISSQITNSIPGMAASSATTPDSDSRHTATRAAAAL